jgi:hypothetical protein
MRCLLIFLVLCTSLASAVPQETPDAAQELARVSRELQETRSELAESRRQIEELRQGLQQLRSVVQANRPAVETPAPAEPSQAAADQDPGFLAAKIAELHQDKVESVSKYPVKISGLVLFNTYRNSGTLDAQDLPSLSFQKYPGSPPPSLAATLRQTVLGITVNGPRVFGAQTSADADVDFAGGNPPTSFGTTNGLLRLRTAKLSLDWTNTTLTIGQENPFFSPLSPTSYATVEEPALSWSGNLWVWTPAIELEHRIALNKDSRLVLQGGVLDPLTEEDAPFEESTPTAGEATRAPAIAGRIALDRSSAARYPFSVGFAAYRAGQQYQAFPTVSSWTVNGDFKLPIGNHLEFSGEWYRGQAVGGLGGGIWTSVVYPESAGPYSAVHPLRSTGGWAQLKLKPATRFEINGAIGQDENFGKELHFFPAAFTAEGFPPLQKNRTEFVNLIYRPNSILLFAVEYRHLFTAPASGTGASGDQINLAAGVHF